jgi:hypothetical protein
MLNNTYTQSKNLKNSISVIIMLIIAYTLKIALAWLFRGGGDAWGGEVINRYMQNNEFSFFAPYLPTSYVLPHIYGVLVDNFGSSFSFWNRAFGVLSDFTIMTVIYLIMRIKAYDIAKINILILMYAFNPISLFVISFHGNYDATVYVFVLLALLNEYSRDQFDIRGAITTIVLLSIATLIKPFALIYAIIFLLRQTNFKWFIILSAIYGISMIFSFSLLMDIDYIIESLRTIIYYKHGNQTGWMSIARELLHSTNNAWVPYIDMIFVKLNEIFILLFVAFVSFTRNKYDLAKTFLLFTVFILISTGSIAMQYLYWLVPLSVFAGNVWIVILYTIVGSLWLVNYSYYLSISENTYSILMQFVPLQQYYEYFEVPISILDKDLVVFFHHFLGLFLLTSVLLIWFIYEFIEIRKSNSRKVMIWV